MKSFVFILLVYTLLYFSVQAQYIFPASGTPWVSGAIYTGGDTVSYNNSNWSAKYYTTAVPGSNGDWSRVSKCGSGNLGPDYAGTQRIIGYLPNWVTNFDYKTFDPSVVTHINVAFNTFQQNNTNYLSTDFASIAFDTNTNRQVDSVLFDNNVLQRAHAKGVTVSVSIGGSDDYAFLWLMTTYATNDAKMEEIATYISNYVTEKGLDGVDLDLECWWADATIAGTTDQGGLVRGDEWGTPDPGPPPAGVGLRILAQKLREKMPSKLISCAVFATSNYGNNYDDTMSEYMDWIGLMTYDFTGSWSASPIGPHSSLYKVAQGYVGQSAANPIYSVQDGLEFWMGLAAPSWNQDGGFNVPKSKLVFGVPFYGYDFSTPKPNNGNGFVTMKWNEIVAAYPNAATSFDPLDTTILNGYIGANNKKIYYDTPKSAAAKINYSRNFGHQGVILWELTGDTPYNSGTSILKAINDAAGNSITTGIAPATNTSAILNIYPNPSTDQCSVSLPNTGTLHYTLIDSKGVMIKEETISNVSDYLNIKTNTLSEGLYIINIVQNDTCYTGKISVIH